MSGRFPQESKMRQEQNKTKTQNSVRQTAATQGRAPLSTGDPTRAFWVRSHRWAKRWPRTLPDTHEGKVASPRAWPCPQSWAPPTLLNQPTMAHTVFIEIAITLVCCPNLYLEGPDSIPALKYCIIRDWKRNSTTERTGRRNERANIPTDGSGFFALFLSLLQRVDSSCPPPTPSVPSRCQVVLVGAQGRGAAGVRGDLTRRLSFPANGGLEGTRSGER